ncbi:diguanylate cyclase [Ramlibacter henchirensis]|uniref:Diguanylate cyclase n=1 Tax=Ramlibacter henchirensis TaxID=204072 RepID=A0A4Z0C515_9BURK|nr:diguanylate cyclase [Ramlibacter henchirensis]TFZ06663.1 diguanylate cyclase [Ramlibacter henchirensis]
MPDAAALLLVFVVFPLWVLSGLADWACHRATRIDATSGLKENLAHWVLFAQAGVAVVAMALLQVNAAVLLVVAAAFVLHELTVWIELRYTVPRRQVRPFEQMVHSFQELMLLVTLLLLAVLAWDQAVALAGSGPQLPDLSLRWKAQPLPPALLLAGAGAVLLFNVLPLAQETGACLRARRRG